MEPCQIGEREESLKRFEKVQSDFLKNMIHEFRSIEKQPRSIETDRDFNKTILKKFDRSKISFDRLKQSKALSNIFKKISTDRKIEWID